MKREIAHITAFHGQDLKIIQKKKKATKKMKNLFHGKKVHKTF